MTHGLREVGLFCSKEWNARAKAKRGKRKAEKSDRDNEQDLGLGFRV